MRSTFRVLPTFLLLLRLRADSQALQQKWIIFKRSFLLALWAPNRAKQLNHGQIFDTLYVAYTLRIICLSQPFVTTNQPTYQPTYKPTNQPADLPTNQLRNQPTIRCKPTIWCKLCKPKLDKLVLLFSPSFVFKEPVFVSVLQHVWPVLLNQTAFYVIWYINIRVFESGCFQW